MSATEEGTPQVSQSDESSRRNAETLSELAERFLASQSGSAALLSSEPGHTPSIIDLGNDLSLELALRLYAVYNLERDGPSAGENVRDDIAAQLKRVRLLTKLSEDADAMLEKMLDRMLRTGDTNGLDHGDTGVAVDGGESARETSRREGSTDDILWREYQRDEYGALVTGEHVVFLLKPSSIQ